jgi:Dimerisation domain
MNTSTAVADQAASQHVFQIATGYIASAALYTAAKLQLADRLAAGPLSAADLARDTNANADVLYRILRTLSSVGIFEERPNGPVCEQRRLRHDEQRSAGIGTRHDALVAGSISLPCVRRDDAFRDDRSTGGGEGHGHAGVRVLGQGS